MQRTLWKVIQPLADAAARRGRGIIETDNAALAQSLDTLLGPSAALLVARSLHGGGTTSHRFARLSLRVEHPPGGLAGALVLHAHKPIVQRQIVPDGVL